MSIASNNQITPEKERSKFVGRVVRVATLVILAAFVFTSIGFLSGSVPVEHPMMFVSIFTVYAVIALHLLSYFSAFTGSLLSQWKKTGTASVEEAHKEGKRGGNSETHLLEVLLIPDK